MGTIYEIALTMEPWSESERGVDVDMGGGVDRLGQWGWVTCLVDVGSGRCRPRSRA